MTKFLKTYIQDSIKYYRENPEEAYKLIGQKAGLTAENTKKLMKNQKFYSIEEQLVPNWMGTTDKPGQVVLDLKRYANYLVKQKTLSKTLDDYSPFVDPSFLETIIKK